MEQVVKKQKEKSLSAKEALSISKRYSTSKQELQDVLTRISQEAHGGRRYYEKVEVSKLTRSYLLKLGYKVEKNELLMTWHISW